MLTFNPPGLMTDIYKQSSLVTPEEMDSLAGGGVPNRSDDYCLTGQYLPPELKVLWALFLRQIVPYLRAKDSYDELGPADANHLAFDALLAAQSRVEIYHQFFWTNFKFQFNKVCRGHQVVGFDKDFQVWVSTAIRRSSNKPSVIFMPYQHPVW